MKIHRLMRLLSGAIICLFIGLIYAWSIFVAPLEAEFGWTRTQTSATFTVSMTSFCIAGMISGALQKKRTPRLIVAIAAVLFLIGFFLSSRINSVLGLYVSYGILCGGGVGLAYNAVISTVTKWFPDKTGLISGILLMCFGFGGMVLGTVASNMIQRTGWRTTFIVFSVLFALILLAFSMFIRPPREDELTVSHAAADPKRKKRSTPGMQGTDMSAGQMIRRPSFWLYFAWAVILSAAGLAVIGNASPCAQEIGASAGTAAMITGMLSVCNGVGRILIGLIFDRFGRKVSAAYANVLIVAALGIIIAASVTGSVAAFIFGGVILGLGYGSVPPLNAAFVNQFYGSRNYAMNFSIVNLNLIPASLLGPLVAGAVQSATGSYFTMYLVLLVACLVIYLAQVMIKRP